ncbi:MAG: DNA polymerase III subunit gamma/tau [Cryomorphaceae bacterium]|nr:MAG: DNA polymerase III subunit gamma/tau [Cryomorphaceae bacterium]
MENFVVSARKYRPQTFDTVVGQRAITDTLRNAIEQNHLAQAFLFCGPRGVGKTSCARILAREINKHTAGQKGINKDEDFSLNILELDAASNNSVEDIRQLTDQVRFPPQVGTHKVYIIDEVHMLSQQAFNAFLKTLEEPPAHAIFILATTEKHKILPTILSRCQIYDFQRITVLDIADHLGEIAEKEGVKAEPEGLSVIAEKADGAMRDALSMFDQLVSFSGNNLTYEAVIEHLNVLDYDYYFSLTDLIVERNIPETLLVYNQILSKGFDGHNFVQGLAQHVRNLMVSKNPKTLILIETSDRIRERYRAQGESLSVRMLLKCLEILNEVDVQYRGSKNQRLLVELALIRMCAIGVEKKNNLEIGSESKAAPGHLSGGVSSHPPTPEPPPPSTPVSASPASPAPPAPQPEPQASTPKPPAEETVQEPSAPSKTEEVPVAEKTEEPRPVLPEAAQSPEVSPENVSRRKKILRNYQSTSVSITAGLGGSLFQEPDANEADEAEDEASQEPQLREEFSEDDLKRVWRNLAEMMKARGRESLFASLTLHAPVMDENKHITLKIANAAQEIEMNREKGEMLEYLRKELRNFAIDLDFELSQNNQPTKLMTTDKKFEAMVQKNPNLGKLAQNLNLDIF